MDKKCYRCKEVRPVNEFFKQARNKDGYNAYCKVCHTSSADRTIHGANQRRKREVQELINQGKLNCSGCKTIRPLDMFYKATKGFNGGYSYTCKVCSNPPEYMQRKKERDLAAALLKQEKKKCLKCKVIKSIDDFPSKGWRTKTCKECHAVSHVKKFGSEIDNCGCYLINTGSLNEDKMPIYKIGKSSNVVLRFKQHQSSIPLCVLVKTFPIDKYISDEMEGENQLVMLEKHIHHCLDFYAFDTQGGGTEFYCFDNDGVAIDKVNKAAKSFNETFHRTNNKMKHTKE